MHKALSVAPELAWFKRLENHRLGATLHLQNEARRAVQAYLEKKKK